MFDAQTAVDIYVINNIVGGIFALFLMVIGIMAAFSKDQE